MVQDFLIETSGRRNWPPPDSNSLNHSAFMSSLSSYLSLFLALLSSLCTMFIPSLLLIGSVALAVAEGCHGDNLLRALERHNGTAYCSSVLYSVNTTTTMEPPDSVPTTYAPLSVSSAVSKSQLARIRTSRWLTSYSVHVY